MQDVTFPSGAISLAGHLHLPPRLDDSRRHSALVCVHPGSGVKEQTAGLYAARMAAQGFVALAFDASYQGASGGAPRSLESPAARVEDIRCAVDFLTTLGFVDEHRIGVLGVCAGGGYAVHAAMTEPRIRAVGTVVGVNIGRAQREAGTREALAAVSAQRTAESARRRAAVVPWLPDSARESTELDLSEAVDYYLTPRGQHPGSNNQLRFTSTAELIAFDAFHLVEQLLTQPLQVIVGDKVGAFGSYRDGYELFRRAPGTKQLQVIEGASHYDLYDQPVYVDQAVETLAAFYRGGVERYNLIAMDALPELRAIIGRHAERGAATALPRLQLAMSAAPTVPVTVISNSTLAIIAQGAKRTGLGAHTLDYGAGHIVITSVKAPVTTQVTRASAREPFLGMGLTLQPALVASLLLQDPARRPHATPRALASAKASDELLDAFRRYARLLDAPRDIPVLADAIEREILWRVMQSPHGAALRDIGLVDSNLTLISRAIDVLQTRFAAPLQIAALARAAHMSPATFHRHFRNVTAMSPLQFQKRLRLQHARTRLLSQSGDVTSVARSVGYQSPSQFSREYRREFGLPPAEEAARWRR